MRWSRAAVIAALTSILLVAGMLWGPPQADAAVLSVTPQYYRWGW